VLVQIDNAAYDEAVSIEDVNPTKAATLLHAVLAEADPKLLLVKMKEDSIMRLGAIYSKRGEVDHLQALFLAIRPFFVVIPKSRTAKIVRALIDLIIAAPELTALHEKNLAAAKAAGAHAVAPVSIQVTVCIDAITWCQTEKRTFLKQRIQSRLAALYVKLRQYADALPLIARLIKEVKKFDDKLLLVEVFLIESRAQLHLQNSQCMRHNGVCALRSLRMSVLLTEEWPHAAPARAECSCDRDDQYLTRFSPCASACACIADVFCRRA
jgi:26S proteasome regulatory subunit N6